MSEKHSTVCYIFREGAFSPVREAKPFHNDFGLDLFQYKGAVYEGRTGLQFCPLKQAADIASFIGKHGGLEKVQKLIADSLERTGLSPRYTRPDEKKKDIFPPKEKDENRVFAKDLMGSKHYYYRLYNENGIELYTMEKKREFFQTVYVPCDGVPFPVSWTVKMKKKQKETQDILSYHTQAAGCSDKARAKASGGRQPIEECGRTGL